MVTMRLQISYDIAEDILVQGDYMNDTLQKLQDAVIVTKVLFILPVMLRKYLAIYLNPYITSHWYICFLVITLTEVLWLAFLLFFVFFVFPEASGSTLLLV